ncbi:MAG: DUF4910 domain-containing protein [Boseongicola sp.]
MSNDAALGKWAHDLARELWPFPRSLTGKGVRQTLDVLERELPNLERQSVPTGYRAFDWEVPREWNLNRAWIETPTGSVICDTDLNNLHVVGYSLPTDKTLPLAALKDHLHTEPGQPDAIPYVTSYYADAWGFCLSQDQLEALPDGDYRAVIDATLEPGHLEYADLLIPGETDQEIVFSTYLCHPSMANNELSGVVVASALARIVTAMPQRKFTYRFVFVPETIGTLVYLSKRLKHLRRHVAAGFVLTCVGDECGRSYLASRWEDTLADRVALAAITETGQTYDRYSFLDRGSDERQYCAPGIDLPFCSVMRSKYGTFPEYHTSMDNLEFVTPKGLGESIAVHRRMIEILENNLRPKAKVFGEPQLGRRGLYDTLSRKGSATGARLLLNVLAYADGKSDLFELSEKFGVTLTEVEEVVALLDRHELLE